VSTGWPLVPIEDIFAIARGGSPRPIDSFLTDDPDGVNWVMISDATESGKYINSTKKRIRQEGVKRSRVVQPGDFLLTNSMSFGRPYIMNTSGCIHDGWLVLSPRNQNVSPDFFYHLLGSDFVYAEFVRRAAGATVKNLNIDLVKGVQVPLPPMPEQRRIADLLDRAEALRAKRRAALGQLDALTQSIFLDLFGDPATNPKGWPLAHVGDVADVQGGLQVSSARKNHPCEIPYLRVANVFRGFLDLSEIKTLRATEAEISRTKLEKDDLLIVEGHGNPAEIGRGALWDGSVVGCIHQNHIIRVRFKRAQVLPLFACSYLNSPGGRRHLLRAGKTTSGLNTISVSEVRSAPVVLPPLSLQHEFASRIDAVEKLKVAYRASLVTLDHLFAVLGYRAFRGEL
jgi:type I restriction enzyme, S subunit